MAYASGREPWWLAKEEQAWQRAMPLLEVYLADQSFRLAQFLKWFRLYGNFPARGLSAVSYFRLADVASRPRHKLTWNVIKSCVDTVTSKIAKNRPKPTFLTSGGSWSEQRRAKLLDKFVWGQFYRTQTYQASPLVFRDACVFGSGFSKVYSEPYEDSERICLERVCPEEIFTDPMESVFGKPRAIYQRRMLNRDIVIAMYPKREQQIRAAKAAYPDAVASGLTDQADLIWVVEAYHLPSQQIKKTTEAKNHDGRYACFIENATLGMQEYRRDYFPFPKFDWTKPLRGFWGQGLAEELVGIQYEINRTLRQIQESLPWAVPKCFIESGSDVVKDHMNDEIGGIIKYKGTPPEIKAIQAISPELFQQLDRQYQKAYEITGVSRMSAAAAKPAGLESKPALREWADIESERFATTSRAYDDYHLEIARQMVKLGKEIYQRDHSYAFMGRDRRYTVELKWKDVDLDEDSLVMQIMPTSGLPQTVSGRLAMVEDIANLGLLPKEEMLRLLDFPDLEAVNQRLEADAEFCNMQIEKMLEKGEAQTPEPFQNLDYAIKQAQASYLLASTMSDVKEENKDLLRRYMESAATMLRSAQAPPPGMIPGEQPGAPSGAPPAGGPPAGPLPGLPPGAPAPPLQ
jgi:hypothetical protein